MARKTKSIIPTIQRQLHPKHQHLDCERQLMEDRKAKTAEHYIHRKALQPLKSGDVVRVQPTNSFERKWTQATVTNVLPNRSYDVTTDDGRQLRRNRRFLRASIPARTEVPRNPQVPVASRTDIHEPSTDQTKEAYSPLASKDSFEPQAAVSPSQSQPTKDLPVSSPPQGSTVSRYGRPIKKVERLNL